MLTTFLAQRACTPLTLIGADLYYRRYEGDNFVLDQQVVRAALKSYNNLISAKYPLKMLSPSSNYLRLLLKPSQPLQPLTDSSWKDPTVAILLLEWRAAVIVKEFAKHANDPDASANQRVSKAVTEAFVAVQVGLMIQELQLAETENCVIRDLYLLVSAIHCSQFRITG